MPREVSDIKQFIEICRRKDAKCTVTKALQAARLSVHGTFADIAKAGHIKRNGAHQIKFKVRCSRFMYTLVLRDSEKADKLKQSLPPNLTMTDVPKKNKKGKRIA
ncbi:hypothetical protein ABVK25_003113 [Lepraria finkii]|uniref:60S ribosomal protein L38 n=1 Tax=Lepraria finkii TaxID=1340010 RepID=A0ABR4BIW2_9LECA